MNDVKRQLDCVYDPVCSVAVLLLYIRLSCFRHCCVCKPHSQLHVLYLQMTIRASVGLLWYWFSIPAKPSCVWTRKASRRDVGISLLSAHTRGYRLLSVVLSSCMACHLLPVHLWCSQLVVLMYLWYMGTTERPVVLIYQHSSYFHGKSML